MDDQDKSLAIGVQVHTDADTRVTVNPSPLSAELASLRFQAGTHFSGLSIHVSRETARRIVDALNGWLA